MKRTQLQTPPGRFGLPVIGETVQFMTDPEFASKRVKKYGEIFKSHIFFHPTIFLTGPEANRFFVACEGKQISNGVSLAAPKTSRVLIGENTVVMRDGANHARTRNLIFKGFSKQALWDYFPSIIDTFQTELETWKEKESVNLHVAIERATIMVAFNLFLDVKEDYSEVASLYAEWAKGLLSIPISLPFTKYGKGLRSRRKLLSIINEIIEKRKQNSTSKKVLIDYLLENSGTNAQQPSDEEVREQILILLFAGHETLSSALTWSMYYLNQNPACYQEIVSEIEQIREISHESLVKNISKLHRLNRFIAEVLRISPPASVAPRKIIENCEFKGYLLPKGWNVTFHIRQTHMSKEFGDPNEFRPDRFRENNLVQDKYLYTPFGMGKRECVGKELAKLEMQIFLIILIKKYKYDLINLDSLKINLFPTYYLSEGMLARISEYHASKH